MSIDTGITLDKTAPRLGSALTPARMLELLLTPRAYFANRDFLRDERSLAIAAFLGGISAAVDRIDQQLFKANRGQSNALLDWALESWLQFWVMVFISGTISAVLLWRLGGWWYKKRLHWSGATEVTATAHDARRVNAMQKLVFVAPSVALTLVQTAIYQNYREAWHGETTSSMLILALLFWSCWTSYCAATTVFPVQKNKARIWFLILPIVFYLMTVGVYGMLASVAAK